MNHTKLKAFTLIELLVVIAIIAILAAILFPVFAQAKMAAKKTTALSNVKNIAMGAMIYSSNSDDLFPLAHIEMRPGTIPGYNSYNRFIPTPQSLATAYATVSGMDTLGAWYANSMRPYIKSEQIWNDPVARSTTSIYNLSITAVNGGRATQVPAAGTASDYGYAMNGLLTSYSSTATLSPATVPLFSGTGMRKTLGATFANPAMYCPNGAAACVYQKATSACGTDVNQNGTASFFTRASGGFGWNTYNGQWIVAFADGHAKSRKIGVRTTGKTDPRVDPMASYNGGDGLTTASMTRWYSGEAAGGCHAYLFRPDFDPSNPDLAVENL